MLKCRLVPIMLACSQETNKLDRRPHCGKIATKVNQSENKTQLVSKVAETAVDWSSGALSS